MSLTKRVITGVLAVVLFFIAFKGGLSAQCTDDGEHGERETLLKGRRGMAFYGGFETRSTHVNGEWALMAGGELGLSFGRQLFIGFAGYGKANCNDPGLPAYGGLIMSFSIMPNHVLHINFGALFGAGTNDWNWNGYKKNILCEHFFYVVEPHVRMVLNVSRLVRFQAGVSYPFTDQDKSGLKNIAFGFGVQFGR